MFMILKLIHSNKNEKTKQLCREKKDLHFSLGGPLANRGTPSATRRMHTLQRAAGRHFFQWALHVRLFCCLSIQLLEIFYL